MRTDNCSLDEILDYEAAAGTMVLSAHGAKQGTVAFMEKRKPAF